MENGNRKITAEEIAKLSSLFGVSADTLLGNALESKPTILFARSFEKLDEADQAEIMNLIRFKEKMKEARDDWQGLESTQKNILMQKAWRTTI